MSDNAVRNQAPGEGRKRVVRLYETIRKRVEAYPKKYAAVLTVNNIIVSFREVGKQAAVDHYKQIIVEGVVFNDVIFTDVRCVLFKNCSFDGVVFIMNDVGPEKNYTTFVDCAFNFTTLPKNTAVRFRRCDVSHTDIVDTAIRACEHSTFKHSSFDGSDFGYISISECAFRRCSFNEALFHRTTILRSSNAFLEEGSASMNELGKQVIIGGHRSDGYGFFAWFVRQVPDFGTTPKKVREKVLMINAGCRSFTYKDAWAHWNKDPGRKRSREALVLINAMVAQIMLYTGKGRYFKFAEHFEDGYHPLSAVEANISDAEYEID